MWETIGDLLGRFLRICGIVALLCGGFVMGAYYTVNELMAQMLLLEAEIERLESEDCTEIWLGPKPEPDIWS